MSDPHEWHVASDKEGDLHEGQLGKDELGTMKEIVRYTIAADQARLARNAMAKAVIR